MSYGEPLCEDALRSDAGFDAEKPGAAVPRPAATCYHAHGVDPGQGRPTFEADPSIITNHLPTCAV
jgi:hypothetical protein